MKNLVIENYWWYIKNKLKSIKKWSKNNNNNIGNNEYGINNKNSIYNSSAFNKLLNFNIMKKKISQTPGDDDKEEESNYDTPAPLPMNQIELFEKKYNKGEMKWF